jgi:hypothetical protein
MGTNLLFLSLVLGLSFSATASATDYGKTIPPAAISDGVVTIGSRTVKLPPGNWSYVSYVRGTMTSTSTRFVNVPVHTGYFANVTDKRFQLGIVLNLPEYTQTFYSWNSDPCNIEGNVYKDKLDTTVSFPECIVINQRTDLHKDTSGLLYPPVDEWLDKQNVDRSGSIYDIWYMHYSSTGQGRVRFFVPASKFSDQQAAIDWAKKLPDDLKLFFQGRTQEATLRSVP